MGLIGDLKLLLQAKKVRDTVADEVKKGWDWQITAKKGLESFGHTCLSILIPGLLVYFADAQHIQALFSQAGVPEAIAVALVPVVKAGITMYTNYRTHRGQPVTPPTE